MVAGSRRRVAAARVAGRLVRPEQVRDARAPARRARAPGLDARQLPAPQLAVIAEVKRRSPSKGDIAPGPRRRRAGARLRGGRRGRDLGAHRARPLRRLARRPARRRRRRGPARAAQGLHRRPRADLGGGRRRRRRRPAHRRHPQRRARSTTCSIECLDCGLDPLVEVHDLDETRRACRAGCTLVGINNRDLVTLEVDIATTEYAGAGPGPCMFPVSESGISTPARRLPARPWPAARARSSWARRSSARRRATWPPSVAALKDPGRPR